MASGILKLSRNVVVLNILYVEIPCRLLTPHFLMKINTAIGFVVAILVILRLIKLSHAFSTSL